MMQNPAIRFNINIINKTRTHNNNLEGKITGQKIILIIF